GFGWSHPKCRFAAPAPARALALLEPIWGSRLETLGIVLRFPPAPPTRHIDIHFILQNRNRCVWRMSTQRRNQSALLHRQSLFSPQNLKRWLRCPPDLIFSFIGPLDASKSLQRRFPTFRQLFRYPQLRESPLRLRSRFRPAATAT